MPDTFVTSRSAYQCYLNSPRLYYMEYQVFGTGIVPKLVSENLQVGIYCHEVCAGVMGGKSEEQAQKEQTEIFLGLAQTRGFDSLFEPALLLALAQGLSKTWLRVRLPQIKKDYEILAVEAERQLSVEFGDFKLLLPVRLDAELKNRYTGFHSAMEMKTTRTNRSYYFEKYNYDIQTLVHHWLISEHYGDCHSILMEFLYKGYTGDNGVWYSPFVRGFFKVGIPPYDETEYEADSKFSRRKDWNIFNVWEEFTQDEWYEKIGGKKLDAQVLHREVVRGDSALLPVFRHQIFMAHQRIAEGLNKLDATSDPVEKQSILGEYFPLAYHQFDHHLIGFNPEQAIESGEYIAREPHHPLEKELQNQ